MPRTARTPPSLSWWSRLPVELSLAGWSLLLHAAWEFLQSPLYADHQRGFSYVLRTRLHCTVGDVLIMLAAFWIASLVAGSRGWWRGPIPWPFAIFMIAGLGYTAFSEWLNTQIRMTWTYAPAMPSIFGLGLAPMLQWLLLPPLVISLIRSTRMHHGRVRSDPTPREPTPPKECRMLRTKRNGT